VPRGFPGEAAEESQAKKKNQAPLYAKLDEIGLRSFRTDIAVARLEGGQRVGKGTEPRAEEGSASECAE
jgi:hypothetical protein